MNIQENRINNYYKFHSLIYDLTRWSFLFGRNKIINLVNNLPNNSKILEVGCGTGHNLILLSKNNINSLIIGVDISIEMIQKAQKKTLNYDNITLINRPFSEKIFDGKFDLILFSYCLTMINPGYDTFIDNAFNLLNDGGKIAVVDFHKSNLTLYKKYMELNHVKMEEQILCKLIENFEIVNSEISEAYFGIWEYFCFVGTKKVN
jgi:S-adenosylmethionine-diacylgycerolhomoserine-N-methlytransferase